jgi:hypothetical protein
VSSSADPDPAATTQAPSASTHLPIAIRNTTMTLDTSHSNDDREDSWDRIRAQRAERATAVRRSEAVLRILKDRSTIVDEAVRMDVDVDTVVGWLAATLGAISRALDREPAPATRRVSSDPRVTQRQIVTA